MSSQKSNPNSACQWAFFPAHLHRNGRAENQQFPREEAVFRRFPPCDIVNAKPPGTIFAFKRMSVMRNGEGFCKEPEDSLYDESEGVFRGTWGVAEIRVAQLEGAEFVHPETNKKYTLKLRHDPTPCMYPHCEVDVFMDGVKVSEMANKLKTDVREYLIEKCDVRKFPSSV